MMIQFTARLTSIWDHPGSSHWMALGYPWAHVCYLGVARKERDSRSRPDGGNRSDSVHSVLANDALLGFQRASAMRIRFERCQLRFCCHAHTQRFVHHF